MNKQMIYGVAFIGICSLVLACSHTYVFDKAFPLESLKKINDRTKGKKGIIQTSDGRKHNANEINVALDSTSWLETKTNSYRTRSNSELSKIVVKDHGKGAVEGLGFGFLSGFAGGFAFGYLASSESGFFGREGGATIAGTALGLLGGFFGLIIGSVSGDQNTFKFNEGINNPKYYLLKDIRIIGETESFIEIPWKRGSIWLNKLEIIVEKKGDRIDVRVPASMYKEKFGKDY